MARLLASLLLLACSGLGLSGCAGPGAPRAESNPIPAAGQAAVLWPSPRLIMGRIIASDEARGFAFVELQTDAPADSIRADAELLVRTNDLAPLATLRASRHLRGRVLGCQIVAGRPAVGAEVVWLPP